MWDLGAWPAAQGSPTVPFVHCRSHLPSGRAIALVGRGTSTWLPTVHRRQCWADPSAPTSLWMAGKGADREGWMDRLGRGGGVSLEGHRKRARACGKRRPRRLVDAMKIGSRRTAALFPLVGLTVIRQAVLTTSLTDLHPGPDTKTPTPTPGSQREPRKPVASIEFKVTLPGTQANQ